MAMLGSAAGKRAPPVMGHYRRPSITAHPRLGRFSPTLGLFTVQVVSCEAVTKPLPTYRGLYAPRSNRVVFKQPSVPTTRFTSHKALWSALEKTSDCRIVDHTRGTKVTVRQAQVRNPAAVFDAGFLLRKRRRCEIASLRQTAAQ